MAATEPTLQETLERRLVEFFDREKQPADGDDPWWAIAAKDQQHHSAATDEGLERGADVNQSESGSTLKCSTPTTSTGVRSPAADKSLRATTDNPRAIVQQVPQSLTKTATDSLANASGQFIPVEPRTLEETDIHDREIEALVLKFMHNCASCTGREIAEQLRLPFNLISQLLSRQKNERLVVYRSSSPANDYVYELADAGVERMRRYAEQCTYFGAAPVSLRDYVRGMKIQSVSNQKPNLAQICAAFSDLVINNEMIRQLGQAMHGGRGLFLYGSPGNGKTSIATRVTRALGEDMWIPRCISVFGEIVRLYDPSNHEVLPYPEESQLQEQHIDRRWVRIRRPTMVVGGELTMENLEITTNKATGISEAPLQMKSNGGTLVIDDFGRQRVSTRELLNRWIIPLENGYDYVKSCEWP